MGDGAESQSKEGPDGRPALLLLGRCSSLYPVLPGSGLCPGDRLSSYLNDFGCPISHGQRAAEASRGA